MTNKKSTDEQSVVITGNKDGLFKNFMFMLFINLFLIISFTSCGETGKTGGEVAVDPIDWDEVLEQDAEWYQSSEAVGIADNVLRNPGDFYLSNEEVTGKHLGVIEAYSSQIITERAIDWLHHKRDTDRPFFLYLSYDAVHEKVQNPSAFNALYNTGNVPKNKYYANVTYQDHYIGRVLDYLDQQWEVEDTILENTIVFFSSDNGTMDLKYAMFIGELIVLMGLPIRYSDKSDKFTKEGFVCPEWFDGPVK